MSDTDKLPDVKPSVGYKYTTSEMMVTTQKRSSRLGEMIVTTRLGEMIVTTRLGEMIVTTRLDEMIVMTQKRSSLLGEMTRGWSEIIGRRPRR